MFRIIVLFLLVLLLAGVSPALAQDSDSAVPPVPLPQDIVQVLGVALLTLLAPVAASPLGSAITAFLKRAALHVPYKPIQQADAAIWSTVSALLIVFVTAITGYFGLQNEWETVAKVILALSGVFGGVAFGVRANASYYQKVARGVPYLGTSRDSRDHIPF